MPEEQPTFFDTNLPNNDSAASDNVDKPAIVIVHKVKQEDLERQLEKQLLQQHQTNNDDDIALDEISLDQIDQEKLDYLLKRLVTTYTEINNILLKKYPFLKVIIPILTPLATVCLLFVIFSLLIIFLIHDGLQWWLKVVGFVIPLFLTWQSLYIMQPIHDDGRIATASKNDTPFTPRVNTSQLTSTTFSEKDLQQQQPQSSTTIQDPQQQSIQDGIDDNREVQIAVPNDPIYLFWAKYWIIYCLIFLFDKTCRPILQFACGELYYESWWYRSYNFWLNINYILLILPPYFWSTLLYNFILEPFLILHFEQIFDAYKQAKTSLNLVVQDSVATATTALRTLGKRAIVHGISQITPG